MDVVCVGISGLQIKIQHNQVILQAGRSRELQPCYHLIWNLSLSACITLISKMATIIIFFACIALSSTSLLTLTHVEAQGKNISKRNAGPSDPEADLLTRACCFARCQNGGLRFTTADKQRTQCVCPFPWTGPECENLTTPCNPDPCQNGGTCSVISSNTFRCDCAVGFTGTVCALVDGGSFTVLCPGNVHLLTPTRNYSQTVRATWPEPDASDYQLMSRSHAPGDSFPFGETIVDYVFGTYLGTQTCSFSVTVHNVTVSQHTLYDCLDVMTSSLSQRGMNVTFTEPTASDSCGSADFLGGTAKSGGFFPLGETSVSFFFLDRCLTVFSCIFSVTVKQDISSVRAIVQTASGPYTSVVLPDSFTVGVQRAFSDSDGMQLPTGMFELGVTRVLLGDKEILRLLSIIIIDDTPPIVTSCGGDIRKEVDSGSNVTVYWTVPSAVDTEGGTVTVTSTHRPGDLFVKGVTTVIYTFWDSGDNLATCSFTVNVYDKTKEEQTVGDLETNFKDCQTSTRVIEVKEQLDEYNITLALSNVTEGTTPLSKHASFSVVLGLNEFLYTFAEGEGATCRLRVFATIRNTDHPGTFFNDCPNDITVNTTHLTNFSEVTWTELTVPSPAVIITSYLRGNKFYIGETTVNYTAKINGTVTDKCTFIVHATDKTSPTVVNCPSDVNITSCRGGKTVHWFEPFAFHNSEKPVLLSQTHIPNKSLFKIGTTRVSYFFQDSSKNVATCHFTVNMQRSQKCRAISPLQLLTIMVALVGVVLLLFIICYCLRLRLLNAENEENQCTQNYYKVTDVKT